MESFTNAFVAGVAAVGAVVGATKVFSNSSSDKEPSKKPKKPDEEEHQPSSAMYMPGSISTSTSTDNGNGNDRPARDMGSRYHQPQRESRRDQLTRVAEKTLQAIEKGSYTYRDTYIPIRRQVQASIEGTQFYGEDSLMKDWQKKPRSAMQETSDAALSILNISTLDAARILSNSYRFQGFTAAPPKTGVLNFASATKPGGGFKNGAEAQEESLARVSTLYPSLTSKEGRQFYTLHTRIRDRAAYYTHSMIYSPGVLVFRNDLGDEVDGYVIEVVSCAAVNAGDILQDKTTVESSGLEVDIEAEMYERMGRVLYLFEQQGIRNIVLGTFGTGVFKNDIRMVARHWAKLLVRRFKHSFDRVIFAITGDTTFVLFKGAFEAWIKQQDTPRAAAGRRN